MADASKRATPALPEPRAIIPAVPYDKRDSFEDYHFVKGLYDDFLRGRTESVRLKLYTALRLVPDEGDEERMEKSIAVDYGVQLLDFARTKSFSALQIMSLLSCGFAMKTDLATIDSEDELHLVTRKLINRLAPFCKNREVVVWDVKALSEIVEEWVTPDPSEIKPVGKGKKGPVEPEKKLVQRVVTKEVREKKTVVAPPLFESHDVADISDMLALYVQHWRLHKHIVTIPREVVRYDFVVTHHDLPSVVAPLSTAINPEEDQRWKERENVYDQYVAAMEHSMSLFDKDLLFLRKKYTAETDEAAQADRIAREEDQANALQEEEVKQAIKVIQKTAKGCSVDDAVERRLQAVDAALSKPAGKR